MDITAESLERIILQFYQSSDVNHAAAHHWLTLAQQSRDAWSFVWELLSPSKSAEVQFFAASTLQSKIAKSLNEVPEGQYEALKNQLTATLRSYCDGQKVIVNRLCIGMAAFILQVSPEKWENPLIELKEAFFPDGSPIAFNEPMRCLLMELFVVLPEETMHIPQGRRGLVRSELQKWFSHVSATLVWTLEWGSKREVEVGVRCARAWMQLGVPLPEAIGDGSVTPLLIQLVCREPWGPTTAIALEALGELSTHPEMHPFRKSILNLVSSLVPAVGALARRWTADGNQDGASAAFTLISSIGESHTHLLLEECQKDVGTPSSQVLLQIIDLLLECTGMQGQYPLDETLSAIPFGFWYILQDEVVSFEATQRDAYVRLLTPVYSRLADILLLKSALPYGQTGENRSFNQEEAESFRCYRTDIADTMTYCHGILRESLSDQLLMRLAEQLEIHRKDASVWQPLEACLHSLLSIAESARADPMSDSNISQSLSAVGSLPLTSNPKLLATALEVVGAHAEWLNENPNAVGVVLPLLVYGLTDVQTAPSATMALKDLSRDCGSGLLPYAQHILNASHEAITRGMLRPAETVRLTYVIGRVVSSLTVVDGTPYLNEILLPMADHVRQLNFAQHTPAVKACILIRLKMIAALISALGTQAEVLGSSWVSVLLPLIEKLLPVMEEVASKWYSDEAIMQAVALVLKNTTITLMDEVKPVLPSILRILITSYSIHQHSVLLDLSKHIILMFNNSSTAEGAPSLGYLMEEMCRCSLFLADNQNAISSDRADVLEALFGLLSQVSRRNSASLASLRPPVEIDTLLCAATQAMSIPEAPVIKSASSFLSNLVMHGSELKEINCAIGKHGDALVHRLLMCIGGSSPRTLTDHIADVLLALSKMCFDRLCRWMNDLLLGPMSNDFPSPRVNRQQKEFFIQKVLRERRNKRRLQEAVREFSLLCRGLSLNASSGGGAT